MPREVPQAADRHRLEEGGADLGDGEGRRRE